jgi:hypothetical protein
LWQCIAKSPGLFATNSHTPRVCRPAPYRIAGSIALLSGISTAVGFGDVDIVAVQVDRVMIHRPEVAAVEFARRSPSLATAASVPGNARLFMREDV